MKTTGKTVVWLCIFSTLLFGCYSYAMIEPTGVDREMISSGTIDYVIMKDDTKYEFDIPPTVVKDAIIGVTQVRVNGDIVTKQVSIRLLDVRYVHVSELQPINTTLAILGILVLGVVIWLLANGVYEVSVNH